ncbi:hypothetical protein LWI29_018955 [Acer saccharum]|uniref:Uncharacterized protein n=1 Tax=Acer saccharum TaxID=4024 RepID=A0AA39RDL7_ACESA|nr:hypothetical protein LWI29_018955 [Acer saccharum]
MSLLEVTFLVFEFILLCFSSIKGDKLSLFCTILWRIWFLRNSQVHGAQRQNFSEVKDWAQIYLSELQAYAVQKMEPSGSVDPQDGSHLDSPCGLILSEVRDLISSMGDVLIKFWMEDFPSCVRRIVEADTPVQLRSPSF